MDSTNSKASKAQNLLGQLRNIVEEQEKTINQQHLQISSLKLSIDSLTKERDTLLEKLKKFEVNGSDIDNNNKKHKRKSSSVRQGRTHSGHKMESHTGSVSAAVDRSGSFHRAHLEEPGAHYRDGDTYELSSDIKEKQLDVLRNHYGGADKCERAARIIQQAYRKHQMKLKFEKIRKSRIRRLTIENNLSVSTLDQLSSNETNEIENSMTAIVGLNSEAAHFQSKTVELKQNSMDVAEDASSELQFSEETFDKLVWEPSVNACKNSDKSDITVMLNQDGIKTLEDNDDLSVEELLRSLTDSSAIAQQHRASKRRKRHGYETVVLLPTTPEHLVYNHGSAEKNPPASAVTAATRQFPNSENEGRRPSLGYQRSSSELSLTSCDNEGDGESMKSSDTGSINSEMFTNVGGDGSVSSYFRKNAFNSRSSWNLDSTNDLERKRLYRIGLNLFNMKPSKGLNFLIENDFVENNPKSVATFLYNRNGLSRQMVGEYLGNTQLTFNKKVLDCVCELMNFSGLELDEALRLFQGDIRVQGEAQKVERLVEAFSQRYCICNPKLAQSLQSPDSIFILAFAIIMLNTDLHSPNMKHEKRMNEQDFIKNLRGVDNGEDISETLLRTIYNRIKARELVTKDDHLSHVIKVEKNIVGKKPVLSVPHRRLISRCRLFQVHDVNKPQKIGLHPREVFLFNDMILITKILQRKKQGSTYTFKQSITLHGLGCFLFDSAYYPHGIRLHNAIDNKVIMTFNAPNEYDKDRFVADVKECIAEVQLMESLRIETELERVHLNSPIDSRSHKKLSSESKKMSTSMQNLRDPAFAPLDFGSSSRSTSSYSLSTVNENNNNPKPLRNGSKKLNVGSSSRNSSRFSSFGTFFLTPNKRNDPKRLSTGNIIPYSAPNGDSSGITLTLHKVHNV